MRSNKEFYVAIPLISLMLVGYAVGFLHGAMYQYSKYEYQREAIADCEKDLPRSVNCVFVAMPREETDDK